MRLALLALRALLIGAFAIGAVILAPALALTALSGWLDQRDCLTPPSLSGSAAASGL